MFGGQAGLPLGTLLELDNALLLGVLQDLDGLSLREPDEGILDQRLQVVNQALLDMLVQQLQIGMVVFEHVADAELEVLLAAVHDVEQVREGQLGLDHPELGQVAGSVRLLGAEGRAEGVYVGKRAAETLG